MNDSPRSPSPPATAAMGMPSAMAGEFLRYFIASALALGLDFGLLVALVERVHWSVQPAAATGFVAGTVLTYALSVAWVFEQRAFARWHEGLLQFALIGLLGLGLNALLLQLFAGGLHLDYRLAKLGATGLSFLFNFWLRRLMLFTRTRPAEVVPA